MAVREFGEDGARPIVRLQRLVGAIEQEETVPQVALQERHAPALAKRQERGARGGGEVERLLVTANMHEGINQHGARTARLLGQAGTLEALGRSFVERHGEAIVAGGMAGLGQRSFGQRKLRIPADGLCNQMTETRHTDGPAWVASEELVARLLEQGNCLGPPASGMVGDERTALPQPAQRQEALDQVLLRPAPVRGRIAGPGHARFRVRAGRSRRRPPAPAASARPRPLTPQ